MPTLPQTRDELEVLRASLVRPFNEAKARADKAEMDRLEALAGQIDDALDQLAVSDLQALAIKLEELRAKVIAATTKAQSWPFGSVHAPSDHERPFRAELQDNDFADAGPAKPAPKPATVSPETVPKVNPGWASNYKELWRTVIVRPEWKKTADAIAKKIVGNQSRYASAVSGTSVPWWFVAVVHAMECSLRFDQHLHNGDPLSARTIRVPKGHPAAGSPPFEWEESARDSIVYEKLDKVADWSLVSALFHWHRYNGINNEYKNRNIPTPYLWSGSQHYAKGKYVADHQFDPEAVSGQAGAVVILKALIDLNAVILDKKLDVESNPAAATGHIASLSIDISGNEFKHVAVELDYPGPLKIGSGKVKAEKRAVRRVQEWLNIHEFVTSIDEDFAESTAEQLRAFQIKAQRPATGELDQETWALLTAPMRRALAPIDHGPSTSLEEAVVRVAKQHIKEKPTEIGGNNCGPWVRLYMKGQDGQDQKWCAGFVCLIVAQAARDLAIGVPFKRQVGVDALVEDAQNNARFVRESEIPSPIKRRSVLRPGQLFVVRASQADWTHTGIVLAIDEQTFDTLEGNTGGDGGTDGANARQGNRSYANKDFVRLV
jgi:lysozyme family protein